MPRPPRLQFAGAIYHVVTRGDGRRAVFHDDLHYQRLTTGLADEVQRANWEVLAYCWMPNHIHLLLRTPEPNLSRGMQRWLSGYANWYAKRNRRAGHLLQGRYKSYLVEGDSYFWTLSRYIHLNPCRGKSPLAELPDRWPHSSYGGYAQRTRRSDFVQYETLLDAWRGECGGKDVAAAYRRFVLEGLTSRVDNRLKSALGQWVIGSEDFLRRMLILAEDADQSKRGRITRRMRTYTIGEIMNAVAQAHGVDTSEYVGFRSSAAGRETAALLCRRYTGSSLAELSEAFGLGHPDSSAKLVLRAKLREKKSSDFRRQMKEIEPHLLLKTDNQV